MTERTREEYVSMYWSTLPADETVLPGTPESVRDAAVLGLSKLLLAAEREMGWKDATIESLQAMSEWTAAKQERLEAAERERDELKDQHHILATLAADFAAEHIGTTTPDDWRAEAYRVWHGMKSMLPEEE